MGTNLEAPKFFGWRQLAARLLRKNPPEDPGKTSNITAIEPSAEELVERERLIGQVISKVIDDMSNRGFTINRNEGRKPGGDPYGAEEYTVTHMMVGYSNEKGIRYRGELLASHLVSANIADELSLEVSDRQYSGPALDPPKEPITVRVLYINRRKSKTEDINRQEEELKRSGVRHEERIRMREDIRARAKVLDQQRAGISLLRHNQGIDAENGTFHLPIADQLSFLRQILAASIDDRFTHEMADACERYLGKPQWNAGTSNTDNVKQLLLPQPRI